MNVLDWNNCYLTLDQFINKSPVNNRCDQCAPGFHQYPSCIPCPCTLAGTLNGACSGVCQCKSNVEGRRCDRCKRGHFALHEAHAQGWFLALPVLDMDNFSKIFYRDFAWPLYGMGLHCPVLFVIGWNKLAGWLCQKSDPTQVLSAKIRSCL